MPGFLGYACGHVFRICCVPGSAVLWGRPERRERPVRALLLWPWRSGKLVDASGRERRHRVSSMTGAFEMATSQSAVGRWRLFRIPQSSPDALL